MKSLIRLNSFWSVEDCKIEASEVNAQALGCSQMSQDLFQIVLQANNSIFCPGCPGIFHGFKKNLE